VCNGSRVCISF
jgi:hypothetical protein